MSYFPQMLGLAVQNFLSAATGIAIAFALIRGFARHSMQTIDNFWADVYRITAYPLLPLSCLPRGHHARTDDLRNTQTRCRRSAGNGRRGQSGYRDGEHADADFADGPIASQEAIKMLGTNDGGFLNANSAHPFENPTVLSNFLQMLEIDGYYAVFSTNNAADTRVRRRKDDVVH